MRNSFQNEVSSQDISEAKEYLQNEVKTDIPQDILEEFGHGELEKLKFEFKKFLIHCVINRRRNIFGIDGFDGSRKTSITTELTNPSTIYHSKFIARESLDIPTPEELNMLITKLYESYFPGLGRTLFFDRTWNNRSLVQYPYEYCSPEQYETFIKTVSSELKRFTTSEGTKVRNFFFEISKSKQKERLSKRKRDPLRSHRHSPSDARAQEMFEVIQGQAAKLKSIYSESGFELISVKSAEKEPAMIALLKCLLQDEDYDKKSIEIDFTPDHSIIAPTQKQATKILNS